MLKVRKASAAQSPGANAQLEAAVWEPLLGLATALGGDPMARELLYVQRCLVPLLGAEHVPEQVGCWGYCGSVAALEFCLPAPPGPQGCCLTAASMFTALRQRGAGPAPACGSCATVLLPPSGA